MLGYVCKYTPIEIFESMGVQMERIEPEVTSFTQADMKMHPNICSFAKGVLEEALKGEYEGIILTTCCDSIRRLYDVLKEELPDKFIYILDIPRITKDAGITLYEKRIRSLISAYETYSGKKFEEKKLEELLDNRKDQEQITLQEGAVKVGILGARANENIAKILKEKGAAVAFDLTCNRAEEKMSAGAGADPDRVYQRSADSVSLPSDGTIGGPGGADPPL